MNNSRYVFLLLAILIAGCAPTSKKEGDSAKIDPLVYPAAPDEPRFAFEKMIVNTLDVTGVSEQDSLKASLTGQMPSGDGMSKPYAVAVHKGRIFVSDTVSRSVIVYDIPEKKTMRFSDHDQGGLKKPLGIDVDGSGNLYVADGSRKQITVFNRDGKFLRSIGSEKMFDRLSSVTVNKEGTRVYAVDIGGVTSENHRVRVFNATTGEHLQDIGKRGSGPGEFNLPRDLAIGRDDQLYVVDSGNFRIQVFDRNGKFLSAFGKVGKQLGDFARPKEVATDPAGNVYVVDTAFGNIQVFSPEGDLLMFIGERSESNAPARYMLPSGVFVDEDGRIYMVDQWFRKIDIFRPVSLEKGAGYFTKQTVTAIVPSSPSPTPDLGSINK